jgi:hypothetical protein
MRLERIVAIVIFTQFVQLACIVMLAVKVF